MKYLLLALFCLSAACAHTPTEAPAMDIPDGIQEAEAE